MQDLDLMCSNAETYNGHSSPIAVMAREMEANAQNMIDQEENMIKDYELLIEEQHNQTLRIWKRMRKTINKMVVRKKDNYIRSN